MKYGMPLGGEDLAAIAGDLHLGLAKGGESFFPLGAEADAPALAGELIYYDEQGAICRCLNWREAQRTMLKEETVNAVLFIESINEEQHLRADAAMAELKKISRRLLQSRNQPIYLEPGSYGSNDLRKE